jgi:broad specificity phosphatase PhoE
VKHLYYIRHGQSVVNSHNVWGGHLDSPLTEQGLQQAHTAAQKSKAKGFTPDLIITTPLVRALTTAQIIADAIGYPKDKIIVDPALI